MSDSPITDPLGKAHRLLAPRVAYLVGSRSEDGEPNVIPVSNVTSVSTEPQQVLLAVLKRWQTFRNLLHAEGFTVSVPRIEHLAGVWKLGARYSGYPAASRTAKLAASGLPFDTKIAGYGPILPTGIGWMQCRTTARLDLGGDHGIFVAEVQQVWFNEAFLDPAGVPQAATNVLMQVTGNRFTTATEVHEIPYFWDAAD